MGTIHFNLNSIMIRGVWQLQSLKVVRCAHGGSSRGAREFIEKTLPQFEQKNPHVQVETQFRNAKHPYVQGKYLNGTEKTIDLRNKTPDAIEKQIMFLRNQKGFKHVKIHTQKTKNPTVQGYWSSDFKSTLIEDVLPPAEDKTAEKEFVVQQSTEG